MKIRYFTAVLTLLFAASLFADEPVRRTIIVKDGKVITSGEEIDLHAALLRGKRPFLGVVLNDITPELREHYGAPKGSGILVGSVEQGSPAEKAGVRVGDIVLTIDGTEVSSSAQLRRALSGKKEGDSVRIEVLRNRSRQALVAAVVEREGLRVFSPVDVEDLTRNLSTRFNSPEWKARVERFGDCGELQTRIKDLEGRLKDLEKRLQK
ncbi:MAG TPA: PDZ domain-containing protein [Thermoanaerobaculia bacterium]